MKFEHVVLYEREIEAAQQLLFAVTATHGYPAGSFRHNLIKAMQLAHGSDLEKLLEAFPEFYRPTLIYRQEGQDTLIKIVDHSIQLGLGNARA